MCLAIPGQVIEFVDPANQLAKVDVVGVRRTVNLALLAMEEGGVGPGDWVLIHVGFAISKIDEAEVLQEALRLPLAYVGAMGSRRTNADRLSRLREAGVTDEELEKLSSPIGLDLGARTPEETAVSIAAEIIASRWGGAGGRLAAMDGRIHHDSLPDLVGGA